MDSAEDYDAEPDGRIGLTVQPGYVDGEAVTNPNGKRACVQRLFTSTVSGPTHSFAVDNDSDLISFCQCDCGWCSEILNAVINMEQGSSKRKPIPPGGGSRDVLDVPTLTDVTTRPPMSDAIGAEKLGAERPCPSEASPQDAEMSCPSEVPTTADAMPLGEVTGTVDSVATNLILCDGSEVARSQLVNDSELSIQQNRYAFSNWLEWRPQTRGESIVDGAPHFLDDGGYLSDGQGRSDGKKIWHGKDRFLSINRGLCIPSYTLDLNVDPNGEKFLVPCLLTPDKKGMLRIPLSADGQVEMDTDVPHRLYSWDDIEKKTPGLWPGRTGRTKTETVAGNVYYRMELSS